MTPGSTPASATPFTDRALVAGALYAAPDRLAQRTTALHRATVSGADATDTIAALTADAAPAPHVMIDVGCGRGTTTVRLARPHPSAVILALDQSPGLLTVVRRPATRPASPRCPHCADFCLYHSSRPERALAEFATLRTPLRLDHRHHQVG